MRVPRSQLGSFDIHGKDAQVIVIAMTDDCQSSRVDVDGKLDNRFGGLSGGLAIFDRALSDQDRRLTLVPPERIDLDW